MAATQKTTGLVGTCYGIWLVFLDGDKVNDLREWEIFSTMDKLSVTILHLLFAVSWLHLYIILILLIMKIKDIS